MKSCPPEVRSNIKMAQLRDLLISKTRVKLLKTFLSHPKKIFYIRQLVRLTGEQINAVRRELDRLVRIGLAKKEPRGNRLYYQLRRDHPFYQNLLSLVAKTTGLGAAIINNKMKIGKIKFAMLSGRFLQERPRKKNEIDLLIVGDVILPQIAALVRAEEARKKQEINYTVMTEDEFNFRKRRRDPFILSILSGSRVMLIGEEETMLEGVT